MNGMYKFFILMVYKTLYTLVFQDVDRTEFILTTKYRMVVTTKHS